MGQGKNKSENEVSFAFRNRTRLRVHYQSPTRTHNITATIRAWLKTVLLLSTSQRSSTSMVSIASIIRLHLFQINFPFLRYCLQ